MEHELFTVVWLKAIMTIHSQQLDRRTERQTDTFPLTIPAHYSCCWQLFSRIRSSSPREFIRSRGNTFHFFTSECTESHCSGWRNEVRFATNVFLHLVKIVIELKFRWNSENITAFKMSISFRTVQERINKSSSENIHEGVISNSY